MSVNIEILLKNQSFKDWVANRRKEIRTILEPYAALIQEDKELASIEASLITAVKDRDLFMTIINNPYRDEPTIPGYNKKAKWIEKIAFVIEECGRPMSSSEITERIIEIEPYMDRKVVSNSVSATLSVNSKENGIFEYMEGEGKTRLFSKK